MILNILKLRKDELSITLIMQLFAFAIGLISQFFVINFSDAENTFEIGTLIALFIILFMGIFMGCSLFERNFNISVSMGVTRKQYIPSYLISTLIMAVIELVVVYVCHFIESNIIAYFYPDMTKEVGAEYFLISIFIIPSLILYCVSNLFVGIMATKYGRKMYFVIWLLWMMICILPGRMERLTESDSDGIVVSAWKGISQFCSQITPGILIGIMMAVSIVFLAVSTVLIKKQQVERF